MAKIVFVSGIHGVGKSTLCSKLFDEFGWRHYSCSDLIKQNSDYIESSKLVVNADKNQEALLRGVSLIEDDTILLDGHFCLLGKELDIIELDMAVFESLSPSIVINVTCDENIILERLKARDGKTIPHGVLVDLQSRELLQAKAFCAKSGYPLINYNSPDSIEKLVFTLRGVA
ncbi:AAA family ATPase [Vibrio anguillarum]|uniref:AAA family ATPase n=2 Tax=Vibrio anguillarum TaxID=55601 RepID=A0AAW4BDN2_VIBAN|nr:AAA family ATPase [Vibrio anguillarum]